MVHIDTSTKTSVAGRTLCERLKQIPGTRFEKCQAFIQLADGSGQNWEQLQVSLTVKIGTRTFIADFVILAKDNRTLLGTNAAGTLRTNRLNSTHLLILPAIDGRH